MGNTYEVHIYILGDMQSQYRYKYNMYWGGEWFIVALFKFWEAKRVGHRCIKLEWRPGC